MRQIFVHLLFKLLRMFAGGGRKGERSTGYSKRVRALSLSKSHASVSAPPVSNLIQSTSDNKEWDGKKMEGGGVGGSTTT